MKLTPWLGLFLVAQLAPAACISAACRTLTPGDIETAVRAAAATLLGPAGAQPDRLRIQILDFSNTPFPPGDIQFSYGPGPVAAPDGLSTLYGRLIALDGQDSLVWARIRAFFLRSGLVATSDLPIRSALDAGQVRKQDVWIPFPETPSSDAEPDESTLNGALLKRSLRAGQILRKSMVDYPLDIHLGQTVDLHVRAGKTHLRLHGVALQNARRGESISIRTSDKTPPLKAEVTGPGAAILRAAPVTAQQRTGSGGHQ
jgi:flagella basal body P-ring formation protein FlgA